MVAFACILLLGIAVAAAVKPAPTITIAPGVELPMVVLGTGSGQHGDVTAAVALWLGNTSGVGIDTAYDYDDEAAIAAGVGRSGKPRSAVFLETKIPCSSGNAATKHIASNLHDLGVASVDLMLLHNLECGWGASVAETWKALEDALAAGQTKAIGVSHFGAANLQKLMASSSTVPALNQCELSVSYHDDATIAFCQQHGIVYQSYSPLCGGFNGSSCTMNGGKNVLTIQAVIDIAKVHNVSAAQVGLRWIVQQGLPLATAIWDLDYMNEDLDLWSWGNLTSAEMQQLAAIAPPPQ